MPDSESAGPSASLTSSRRPGTPGAPHQSLRSSWPYAAYIAVTSSKAQKGSPPVCTFSTTTHTALGDAAIQRDHWEPVVLQVLERVALKLPKPLALLQVVAPVLVSPACSAASPSPPPALEA